MTEIRSVDFGTVNSVDDIKKFVQQDLLGVRPSIAEVRHVTGTIDKVLGKGQFQIKAWNSNSQEIDQTSSEQCPDLLSHKWDREKTHLL